MPHNHQDHEAINQLYKQVVRIIVVVLAMVISITLVINFDYLTESDTNPGKTKENLVSIAQDSIQLWKAPDIESIADSQLKKQVKYGKELIVHTSKYLGPKGTILKISNGMNCQNCHLDAGTKPWGNNYGSVASLYPKYRARSGTYENIYKRVNDCFERSLNGKPLDTLSLEMQAIKAYILFLGSNVEKGTQARGSGLMNLAFLDRPADPLNGKTVYESKCQSCHQKNGEGTLLPDGTEFAFPPLWGKNSYNDGAGLYRIINFAKYVKYNMPLGATYANSLLTDQEAWDVAAYVNSQKRPHIDVPDDWPDISRKPIDHPFGPYADQFSEKQHKFGDWRPIEEARKKKETAAGNSK
jgi:thiosulfate dehydrogenase